MKDSLKTQKWIFQQEKGSAAEDVFALNGE